MITTEIKVINFKGCHVPKDIILMCIRCNVAYPLSYLYDEELMEERGISLDQVTVNRLVVKYSPVLEAQFRKSKRWSMDEIYIKVKGAWVYYWRAVDEVGQTIDFFLFHAGDALSQVLF